MEYMPLLPNERVVPGFDPSTAKFSGSYNLVWTPEQIGMLIKVCVQNFKDGEDTVKAALKDVSVESQLGELSINHASDALS
jgi:phospholipase A2